MKNDPRSLSESLPGVKPGISPAAGPESPSASSDPVLRDWLHQAWQDCARDDAAPSSTALQQRVLAQWRQVNPMASSDQTTPLHDGTTLQFGVSARHRQRIALMLLVLGCALAAWWQLRPDPTLAELLQPDVLSELGLGEL